MRWLFNSIYILLLLALSPLILWRCLRHGRYRRGTAVKLFGAVERPQSQRPIVWFHAVSVGEVIQLQKVVDEYRKQTGNIDHVVVTTSTDTGYDLAVKRFADCTVTWFPLDFSWAVARFLHQLQPKLLVLMELELWPNLLAACNRFHVPVAVINARMSDRSFRGYRRINRLLKPVLSRLSLVAAQSQQYADRLVALGVRPDRTELTGSIKFDGVATSRETPATLQLKQLFEIEPPQVVFIAGSTQHPEEELALAAWRKLQTDFPHLRLILVPRHKERFDEVASMVQSQGLPLIRRSQLAKADDAVTDARRHSAENGSPVILLDTIGELSACWGLADLAFVGGSFGARGGQNMIEPAAYGAAVLFGPNTSNFRDVVALFQQADACLQVTRPDDLLVTLRRLLEEPSFRSSIGQRAQQVVLAQQGATRTTAALLSQLKVTGSSHESRPDRTK